MSEVSPGKSSKRVLYVIGSLELGGAERHVTAIASSLRMRGWETSVFALSPSGPLKHDLSAAGVPVKGVDIPAWVEVLLGRRFASRFKLMISAILLGVLMFRDRGLIVHFFLPASYIVGGLAACLVGARPRIMSRRSLNFYQTKSPIYRKLEYFLHPRMDFLVGNSLAVTGELEDESRGKIPVRLIYNGINSAGPLVADGDRIRRELELDSSALVFVIVANLIPYKGHEDLLLALARIRQQLPERWYLLCVGRDDGILQSLRHRAQTLGIGDNVLWLGSRMDVAACLAAADIAISASHEEGFSNAVLEAMLAELPLVVTDAGGNSEAVVDGVTGYVVPAHAPHELGAALLKLVLDAARRGEMGARGRQRVIDQFSMTACLNAYEALYADAIGLQV